MRFRVANIGFEVGGLERIETGEPMIQSFAAIHDSSCKPRWRITFDCRPSNPHVNQRIDEDAEGLVLINEEARYNVRYYSREIDILIYTNQRSHRQVLRPLRAALGIACVKEGAVGFHSSAVNFQGRAVLFLGRSGQGKSTIAQLLSPPCAVIGDDFNFVVPDGNNFRIWELPFHNDIIDLPSRESGRLEAVYLLKKDLTVSIKRISLKESLLKVLKNVYYLDKSTSITNNILDAVSMILASIPVFRLSFDNYSRDQIMKAVWGDFNEIRTQ